MKKFTIWVLQLLALCSSLVVLNSCDGDSDYGYGDNYDQHDFPPFYVSNDHRSATLDGTIDSNSFSQFNQMINQHPEIEVILFDQAPGSVDDDVNVEIGRLIRDLNLDTHIIDSGIIASGAVDLFLAGRNRTRGFNTSVAVNAWADSNGNEASDFPENSSVHDFYINYYLSIGLGGQLANDFYFFTINAADSNDLYFMDESEISFYEIFTE
jgi:hypothetical protein